ETTIAPHPSVSSTSSNGIGTLPVYSQLLSHCVMMFTNLLISHIAASEALVSPPPAPVKPGILIVTLHEGKGFALSPQHEQIFNAHFQNTAGSRPSSSSASGHTRTTSGINAAPTIHG